MSYFLASTWGLEDVLGAVEIAQLPQRLSAERVLETESKEVKVEREDRRRC
jgi:hypothetical protein